MTYHKTCQLLAMIGLLTLWVFSPGIANAQDTSADTILVNGKIITQDPLNPRATAVAIKDGIITATGGDAKIRELAGSETQIIDVEGRTVIPGLNDSHAHVVRGGRFYNLELRWDGVRSLERGINMIAEQAKRTPPGEWVRVIGGWSPFQFEERRMPNPAELTQAAPDTPVFVLFLYSRGFLNKAGVEALGITADTEPPVGGRYEITADGGAILHAEPNPTILYKTIGALPGLEKKNLINSTRHFYRELNRFGITSGIDAGGGGHKFPDDYLGSFELAETDDMPIRVSSYLFPQTPGKELEDFKSWTLMWPPNVAFSEKLKHGFLVEGGGEFLTWSAGDFENWLAEMPDISLRPSWRQELTSVTRHLLKNQWPIRIHATYDESISHIMDVFEEADRMEREAGRSGFAGVRWAIDHAETVGPENLKRIAALGGGIAIQARMAYAGEYFVERYGEETAEQSPPIRDIIEAGIPIGAGTDATRVASYNPWPAIRWLVTGKTVGGMETRSERHLLSREEALQLYTTGSAWFSGEDALKGRIAPGQFADLAVLSEDYLSVPEDQISEIESVLTITGGRLVYGTGTFADYSPALPAVVPQWSPVAHFSTFDD